MDTFGVNGPLILFQIIHVMLLLVPIVLLIFFFRTIGRVVRSTERQASALERIERRLGAFESASGSEEK